MYYVYGIIDPNELPDEHPDLAQRLGAVFYVGKGTKQRSEDHFVEARKLLENERLRQDLDEDYDKKLARIINLYNAGTPPRTEKLAAGFENEQDAYRVEAFAIETVNALRQALGREPLTNKIKGHGYAVEEMESYIARLDIERVEVAPREGDGTLALMVSTDSAGLSNSVYEYGDPNNLRPELRHHGDQIKWMEWVEDLPLRRGWDVHNPWSDAEARERAQKFWPLGWKNVLQWVTDPDSAPKHLLLCVKESKMTVVRYAWHIDPHGVWECYGDRWGIPLGKPYVNHPLLNTAPVINDKGAMLGKSDGCKQIRF